MASTLTILLASHRATGSAVSGTNATSQWVWYPEARHVRGPSVKYTLVGYAVHHASSLFWAAGYEALLNRFSAVHERLVALARAAAEDLDGVGVYSGRIASGDTFVSDPAVSATIAKRFSALCTEMEGAACAQVCSGWQVPFVIVRSISDGADASAQSDFRAFTKVAAANAEKIVRGVVRRLVARG